MENHVEVYTEHPIEGQEEGGGETIFDLLIHLHHKHSYRINNSL